MYDDIGLRKQVNQKTAGAKTDGKDSSNAGSVIGGAESTKNGQDKANNGSGTSKAKKSLNKKGKAKDSGKIPAS